VALTPQLIIGAGLSGAVAGGLPGAGAAILATVLGSFNSAKAPDRFAGTPKEPLELPFWDVMRQFQGVIAQKWMEHNAFGGPITDVLRKAAPRNAGRIITQMFERATVEQIKAIIGIPGDVIVAERARLEGNDLINQSEGSSMVENPVTGLPQGPSKVDRAFINEGLGNEITTQPQARDLAPTIVPVVDVARFLVHEMIIGNNKAYVGTTVLAAGSATTPIRIVAKEGFFTYVKSARFDIAPDAGALIPSYRFTFGAARASSVVIVKKTHFQVVRKNLSGPLASTYSSGERGPFEVPLGLDYFCEVDNAAGAAIRFSLQIEAYRIPKGVVGSYC